MGTMTVFVYASLCLCVCHGCICVIRSLCRCWGGEEEGDDDDGGKRASTQATPGKANAVGSKCRHLYLLWLVVMLVLFLLVLWFCL